jgi:hypothetical protein
MATPTGSALGSTILACKVMLSLGLVSADGGDLAKEGGGNWLRFFFSFRKKKYFLLDGSDDVATCTKCQLLIGGMINLVIY